MSVAGLHYSHIVMKVVSRLKACWDEFPAGAIDESPSTVSLDSGCAIGKWQRILINRLDLPLSGRIEESDIRAHSFGTKLTARNRSLTNYISGSVDPDVSATDIHIGKSVIEPIAPDEDWRDDHLASMVDVSVVPVGRDDNERVFGLTLRSSKRPRQDRRKER